MKAIDKIRLIFKEDEQVWRVSDLIASGSSEAIYSTRYWSAVHNGFNVFKTKEEAENARDCILKVLSKNIEDTIIYPRTISKEEHDEIFRMFVLAFCGFDVDEYTMRSFSINGLFMCFYDALREE